MLPVPPGSGWFVTLILEIWIERLKDLTSHILVKNNLAGNGIKIFNFAVHDGFGYIGSSWKGKFNFSLFFQVHFFPIIINIMQYVAIYFTNRLL